MKPSQGEPQVPPTSVMMHGHDLVLSLNRGARILVPWRVMRNLTEAQHKKFVADVNHAIRTATSRRKSK